MHCFLYNPETKLAVCKDGEGTSFPFPGVFLWENFISEEEEKELISSMDQDVWNLSQSGRRKQVNLKSFNGNTYFSPTLQNSNVKSECDKVFIEIIIYFYTVAGLRPKGKLQEEKGACSRFQWSSCFKPQTSAADAGGAKPGGLSASGAVQSGL